MYKWINTETGELRKNLWDVTTYLVWYFFYSLRHGYKNPIMPGKWKYNRKGW